MRRKEITQGLRCHGKSFDLILSARRKPLTQMLFGEGTRVRMEAVKLRFLSYTSVSSGSGLACLNLTLPCHAAGGLKCGGFRDFDPFISLRFAGRGERFSSRQTSEV